MSLVGARLRAPLEYHGAGWAGWLRGDATFLLALAVTLLAFRWPVFFYPYELNPDESGHISQALTLRIDPIFWRSVAAGTSGPLNVYPQLFLHCLGFPANFATARFLALTIVVICLASFYLTCRCLTCALFARVATLVPATFFALTTNDEFTHCTSEHIPMLLLGVATYLTARLYSDASQRSNLHPLLAGVALGAVPFAKLQGSFIALTIAGFCAAIILVRKEDVNARFKAAGYLVLGGVLVPVLFFVVTVSSGAWEHFWIAYIKTNLAYAGAGESAEFVRGIRTTSLRVPELVAYFQGTLASGVLMLSFVAVSGLRRGVRGPDLHVFAFATAVVIVAIYSAIAPQRLFPHYLLFAVFPLSFWAFSALLLWLQRRDARAPRDPVIVYMVGFWAVIGVMVQLSDFLSSEPPKIRGKVREFVTKRQQSPVATAILRYAARGERLLVWGWMNNLHVETGMPRATRDLVLEHIWNASQPVRRETGYLHLIPDYFKNLYVSDARRSSPVVIVDAVVPGAFGFSDPSLYRIETFPPLAQFVSEQYLLAEVISGIRIFVRKDRMARVAGASSPMQEESPRHASRAAHPDPP
jgi:hypothetical protein